MMNYMELGRWNGRVYYTYFKDGRWYIGDKKDNKR